MITQAFDRGAKVENRREVLLDQISFSLSSSSKTEHDSFAIYIMLVMRGFIRFTGVLLWKVLPTSVAAAQYVNPYILADQE